MKRKLQIAAILSIICLSTTAFAQNQPDTLNKEPQFGFLLNIVRTSFRTPATGENKSILGAQLGLSYQNSLTKILSLVSEFYFIMKGGKLAGNTMRLYTFELPVLARVYFGNVYVNAGPSIAYNFYGTSKLADVTTDLPFNNSAAGFKRWDAGLQFGGGYNFHIKQTNVGLDVRYSYGLTNVSYGPELHNRYLNIGVHFSKKH